MSEDKKDAVNIGVTLSTQLITASLTMIAVIGAFTTFTLDKREIGKLYYVIIGISFFSFIASIVAGGKGIDKARKAGSNSNWDILLTKSQFNNQAFLCFLGILFFIISVFIGKEKPDSLEKKVNEQEKTIIELKTKDESREKAIQKLSDDYNNLTIKLDELKKDTTRTKK